jgi:pimeloyl-ACP methyl ester carboxylesterase
MELVHKYVLVSNVNIHYVESGTKKDKQPTLIFLHGFPEYWGVWQQQLMHFSPNYRVIAPDLPGYNLSDKPADSSFYTIPNLVNFIAKFIACVSANEKVILVAHDWGGAIAWPLTAFHPQLIEKLIILNAPHPSTFTREMINNPKQRSKSEYIHELIADNAVELLERNNYEYLADKIFGQISSSNQTKDTRNEYLNVWQQAGAINGMMQYYRAMPQLAPLTDESSEKPGPIVDTQEMKIPNIQINVPTLVLWGEQDQAFVIETLNNINDYVHNCQIERFSDTSHWLQHEKSPEINHAIEKFI